jgi:hypothetical protein
LGLPGTLAGSKVQAWRADAVGADDPWHVRPHRVGLRRAIAHRMAVEAARALDHLADFGEQGDRTRFRIFDPGKGRDRLETGGRLRFCGAHADRSEHERGRSGQDEETRAHTRFTIGSWVGRARPSFASALAMAGPQGGTPGSPIPVGAAVELRIVTSTSGISMILSDR